MDLVENLSPEKVIEVFNRSFKDKGELSLREANLRLQLRSNLSEATW